MQKAEQKLEEIRQKLGRISFDPKRCTAATLTAIVSDDILQYIRGTELVSPPSKLQQMRLCDAARYLLLEPCQAATAEERMDGARRAALMLDPGELAEAARRVPQSWSVAPAACP